MKLKNKKTGEIGYPYFQNWKEITCVIVDENAKPIAEYTSLAELNEEWEDYEEPKNPCFINWFGEVSELLGHINDREIEKLKEAGNYFETKEEAEKAVEKLKAWKRLKDKGFKSFSSNICGNDFVVNFKLTNHVDYIQSIDDFDCIFDFGGEE